MANPITLGIATANAPYGVDIDEIIQFINSANQKFETFVLSPVSPGAIRAAVRRGRFSIRTLPEAGRHAA